MEQTQQFTTTRGLLNELPWPVFAKCRASDPELFFPVGSDGPALEQEEAAKNICHTCPVRRACLRWALKTGQEFGIWGGASEEERRVMRRNGHRP